MTEQLVGASVWEQDLYRHLVDHEDNERELLLEYQNAAASSQSPAFRYLAALIVDDELRHHQLLREMAESLKLDAEFRPGDPAVPRLGDWGGDPRQISELSDRLVAHEELDLEALKQLKKEMESLKETTMWSLLLRLMELDTIKHIEILNFVRRHSRKALI